MQCFLKTSFKVLQQLSKGHLSKETVVQGTFVQWHSCPSRLLSKETFVQGSVTSKSLLKLIFLFSIETYHTCVLYSEKKNNMSSFHLVKLTPWTKVSLDNSLLGQQSLGQKSLGQLSPWTIVPWTIVATPHLTVCQFSVSGVWFIWCNF